MFTGQGKARAGLIFSMFVFGTIGIFRRYIPLPSGFLALSRGFIGALFLAAVVLLGKKGFNLKAIKKNLALLLISGAAIGFNWILLFEAYNYTSVATATLCYYAAPIFVILASPILFGERLTPKKLICVCVSALGMVMISGILDADFSGLRELTGVFLGLGAALLYASVVLMNKKIKELDSYDKTSVQLASAAAVLVPYVLIAEDVSALKFDALSVTMLLVVGIFHTGVSYALYFGSMDKLKAQTVALFSYIDPVVAIILSAAVLGESIGVFGYVGALLVLGAAFVCELPEKG